MTKQEFPKAISDRFEITEKLVEGGMGNVYLAQDKQLPRKVAIKEVRKEFLENEDVYKRIERESQLHAKIGSHQNIVTLYDVVQSDQGIYLILEHVVGQTLAEIVEGNLKNGVRLSESVVVDVVQQLLKALKRIHLQNVVHRDLKPDNLLIARDDSDKWQVKLMDFGIAKASSVDDKITKLTQVGSGGPGTPSYMAPEQIDPATFGDISQATDLYAVGIIFYELMAGVPPFSGTLTEVYGGHLMRDVADLTSTTKMTTQWREIICKALEKNQDKRFRAADEFAEAIEICLSNAGDPVAGKHNTQVYTDPDTLKTRVTQPETLKTQVAGGDALALLLESSKGTQAGNKGARKKTRKNSVSSKRKTETTELMNDQNNLVANLDKAAGAVVSSGPMQSMIDAKSKLMGQLATLPIWSNPIHQKKLAGIGIASVALVGFLVLGSGTDDNADMDRLQIANEPIQSLDSYTLGVDASRVDTSQSNAVMAAFDLARATPVVPKETVSARRVTEEEARNRKANLQPEKSKTNQSSRFSVEETKSKKIQN